MLLLVMLLIGGALGYLLGRERLRGRIQELEEVNVSAVKLMTMCMESAVTGGVFKNYGPGWVTCDTCGYDYTIGFGYCEPCARVRRAREEALRGSSPSSS